MKNENVLKTPQLLTKPKLRAESEIKIQVTDDDGQQTLHVHNYSHKDAFGWGFPEVEDAEKKKNVVDRHWLNEYNDEIDNLQIVIKKERSLSFNSQSGNLLGNRSTKSEVSELEESFSSAHSFEIELPERSADEILTEKRLSKSNSLFLQVNGDELCSSTPIADIFCSIRSCPSRDSGISASDDIQMDRSLLEELEGVSENELSETSEDQRTVCNVDETEQCDQSNERRLSESTSLTEGSPADSQRKCPVWYKKFSIGRNDLILNFNALNWGLEPEFEEEELDKFGLGKDDAYDSLLSSRSDKGSSSDDCVDEVECVNSRRRQSLRELWTVCDKLEASSLCGGRSFQGLPEIIELVESLNKIDSRLEMLKCDLQNLTRQATENRHEFNSLQKRTSNLLTDTESSRHHMHQLFCLERLEERLQEEWWAVHYPELVTLDENHIV